MADNFHYPLFSFALSANKVYNLSEISQIKIYRIFLILLNGGISWLI